MIKNKLNDTLCRSLFQLYSMGLEYLIFSSINIDCCSMGQDHIMSYYKWFPFRIPRATIPKRTRTPRWWVNPRSITTNCNHIWFIESDPILDPVPIVFETYICKICKIFPEKKNSVSLSIRIKFQIIDMLGYEKNFRYTCTQQ